MTTKSSLNFFATVIFPSSNVIKLQTEALLESCQTFIMMPLFSKKIHCSQISCLRFKCACDKYSASFIFRSSSITIKNLNILSGIRYTYRSFLGTLNKDFSTFENVSYWRHFPIKTFLNQVQYFCSCLTTFLHLFLSLESFQSFHHFETQVSYKTLRQQTMGLLLSRR